MLRRRIATSLIALALSVGATVGSAPTARAALTCGVDVLCFTLTVKLTGNGNGTYITYTDKTHSTADGFIDCEEDDGLLSPASGPCKHTYQSFGQPIIVYGQVTPGAFSLTCDGPDNCDSGPYDVEDTLTTSQTDTADFELQKENIGITLGPGGRVTSQPAGIDCRTRTSPGCSGFFTYNALLKLVATPAAGYRFVSWGYPCDGQPATCILHPQSPYAIQVTFTPVPPPPPTARPATPRPTGSGPGASAPLTQPSVGAATPATSSSGASGGATTEATSTPGAIATTDMNGSDLTPIVLAILVGSVVIAGSLVAVALVMRRRAEGPRA